MGKIETETVSVYIYPGIRAVPDSQRAGEREWERVGAEWLNSASLFPAYLGVYQTEGSASSRCRVRHAALPRVSPCRELATVVPSRDPRTP